MKRHMAMVLGAVLVCGALAITVWLSSVSLFVHPEYTRPQLLWAYLWQIAAAAVGFFGGVTILERTGLRW